MPVAVPYTPFYCEENAWQLASSSSLPAPLCQRFVVWISNEAHTVAMWGQRAARGPDPVVWDYHVVVVAPDVDGASCVWDPDTRDGMPLALLPWLARSFRPVAAPWAPRFRVFTVDAYRAAFSSDRSHMRDAAGAFVQPPPSWPPIFDATRGHRMPMFLDAQDVTLGPWLDVDQLLARLGSPAHEDDKEQ